MRGGGGLWGGEGAEGQIKTVRKTKTLQEGDGCGLQGEGGVRVVFIRDFGVGGWRVVPCKHQPSPCADALPSLPLLPVASQAVGLSTWHSALSTQYTNKQTDSLIY